MILEPDRQTYRGLTLLRKSTDGKASLDFKSKPETHFTETPGVLERARCLDAFNSIECCWCVVLIYRTCLVSKNRSTSSLVHFHLLFLWFLEFLIFLSQSFSIFAQAVGIFLSQEIVILLLSFSFHDDLWSLLNHEPWSFPYFFLLHWCSWVGSFFVVALVLDCCLISLSLGLVLFCFLTLTPHYFHVRTCCNSPCLRPFSYSYPLFPMVPVICYAQDISLLSWCHSVLSMSSLHSNLILLWRLLQHGVEWVNNEEDAVYPSLTASSFFLYSCFNDSRDLSYIYSPFSRWTSDLKYCEWTSLKRYTAGIEITSVSATNFLCF